MSGIERSVKLEMTAKRVTCSWCRGYGHPFLSKDICKLCGGVGRVSEASE